MTEQDFLRRVLDLAKLSGWLVAHFRPAMTARGAWVTRMDGHTGFPDLICVRPAEYRRKSPAEIRGFAAELKVGRRKVTPEQQRWLDALSHISLGFDGWMLPTFIWYPSDWEEIVSVLTSISRPA